MGKGIATEMAGLIIFEKKKGKIAGKRQKFMQGLLEGGGGVARECGVRLA